MLHYNSALLTSSIIIPTIIISPANASYIHIGFAGVAEGAGFACSGSAALAVKAGNPALNTSSETATIALRMIVSC